MSKLNKIVTNYPITLTPEEVANLSETLSAVRTAGGGEGGQIYIAGDSNIKVDNENYRISLTEKATGLLERDIPSAVSQLSDSASYAKVEALSNYQPVGDYLSANALDNLSGTWENVTAKLDKDEFADISGRFLTSTDLNGYATEQYVQAASAEVTGWVNTQNYLTDVPDTYYLKTETSGKDEISDAFSNIPAYILTGDSNITATSAQEGKDIKWNLSINAHPTVTDTTLTGARGIYTHTTDVSGQWCVELVQSAYDAINNVSNKLNSSDFTTYTGTTAPNTYLTKTSADTLYQPTGDYVTTADVLTGTSNTLTGIKIDNTDYTIPTTDLSDYYTKTQVDSTFASASQLNSYLTTAQYETDSATYVTSGSEISAAGEQYALTTTGWAKVEIPATFSGVTTTGSVSGGGVNNDTIGLLTSAENALTAVANKVDKPADMTSNTPYCFSGGQWADITQTYYSKSEATGTFLQKNLTNTLSGDGTSNNTLGVNWSNLSGNTIASANNATNATYATNLGDSNSYSGLSDIQNEFGKYVHISGDTMSGGLINSAVSGKNILAVASAATLIGASRQGDSHFGVDNQALGTTWMGVGGPGMYRGFFKYTQGGNVGALDSDNMMQIEFTPSNKGQIFAKATNNGTAQPETQIINATTASVNNMQTSGIDANNISGPNYMIAKNADGQFVIGAAVFNCQGSLPGTLQPNTYYFVY